MDRTFAAGLSDEIVRHSEIDQVKVVAIFPPETMLKPEYQVNT